MVRTPPYMSILPRYVIRFAVIFLQWQHEQNATIYAHFATPFHEIFHLLGKKNSHSFYIQYNKLTRQTVVVNRVRSVEHTSSCPYASSVVAIDLFFLSTLG